MKYNPENKISPDAYYRICFVCWEYCYLRWTSDGFAIWFCESCGWSCQGERYRYLDWKNKPTCLPDESKCTHNYKTFETDDPFRTHCFYLVANGYKIIDFTMKIPKDISNVLLSSNFVGVIETDGNYLVKDQRISIGDEPPILKLYHYKVKE